MVGFGFMDNIIMIQAGDAIDATFGVAFGGTPRPAAARGAPPRVGPHGRWGRLAREAEHRLPAD